MMTRRDLANDVDGKLPGDACESRDERVGGLGVDVLRGVELDQLAQIEHPDAVGEREGLGLVVGYVHGARAGFFVSVAILDAQAAHDDRRPEWRAARRTR